MKLKTDILKIELLYKNSLNARTIYCTDFNNRLFLTQKCCAFHEMLGYIHSTISSLCTVAASNIYTVDESIDNSFLK